jgi:hypothetical protein
MRKIVSNWVHLPGKHCASTAIRDTMRFNGHDLTEAMCFGLGAGLGVLYLKADSLTPTRLVMTRSISLEVNFFNALKLPFHWKQEDDPEKALAEVKAWIDLDVPVLLQADIYYLDYYRSSTHFNAHVIAMWGYDDGKEEVYLSDTERAGLQTVSYSSLAKARTSSTLPPVKNNWHEVNYKEPLGDLKRPVIEAIRKNADNLLRAPEELPVPMGIRALTDLARDLPSWSRVSDWKWCARFTYQVIEKRGTGGSAFRKMYTDFLGEAEEIAPEIKPLRLKEKMAEIAATWTQLASVLKEISESSEPSRFREAVPVVEDLAVKEEAYTKEVLGNLRAG